MFEDDAFDDVGDVLAPIRRVLERVVDFLPLENEQRIGGAAEEIGERGAKNLVADVLEGVVVKHG